MKIYKRTVFGIIGDVVLAAFAGIAVWYLLEYWVVMNAALAYAAGAAMLLLTAYAQIRGESLRFELDGRTLRHYRRGRLTHTFDLAECALSYTMRGGRTSVSIATVSLHVRGTVTGENTYIECSPLGRDGFLKMWGEIEKLSNREKLEK
jgi:hypothetical protein